MTARTGHESLPFDVDALMAELTKQVSGHAATGGIIPAFAEDFTGAGPRDFFSITPRVHGSTKPVVGPIVTRGKGMAARAAEPMVAGLAEQVAVALSELRTILDDILEEQALLKDAVAALRREVTAIGNRSDEPPRHQ